MDARRRSDLAAATCIGGVAMLLLVAAASILVPILPDLLGDDEHRAGDATMVVMIVLVPLVGAGIATLAAAIVVASGTSGGRAIALLWSVLAGLAVIGLYLVTGGYLAAPFPWVLPLVAIGAVAAAWFVLAARDTGRG